ncbi:MAG: hypothetical protein QOG58_4078, partial [Caballeronia sp.]|nr:hypothetical protein [Caballeronia sp.]
MLGIIEHLVGKSALDISPVLHHHQKMREQTRNTI